MRVIEWTNKSNPLLSTRDLASRLSDRVRCVYSRNGRLERQKESSSDSDRDALTHGLNVGDSEIE